MHKVLSWYFFNRIIKIMLVIFVLDFLIFFEVCVHIFDKKLFLFILRTWDEGWLGNPFMDWANNINYR